MDSKATEARKLLEDLDFYLNTEMKNAADGNFKLLKRCFESRSNIQPRVYIKISYQVVISIKGFEAQRYENVR